MTKITLLTLILRTLPVLVLSDQASRVSAQNAAPQDLNAVNRATAKPSDPMADAPETSTKQGALPAKPISTDTGAIGELLRTWAKEGTAAGNVGDWYDNRDGGHSMLDLAPYPQLQLVPYSEEDIKEHRHWALAQRVLPQVTFGNSSTSSSPETTGSNARKAYCSRAGIELLERQYRGNNLYIYPEHRDHDTKEGEEGDGDLFPANTPCVVISKGSSGSDQAFMRAVPWTLAALRPEVKARLVEHGLLMPVVQMILRQAYKKDATPEDYLTGRAHPTVFDGGQVNAQRMVELAHEITADKIPPLVQLRLVEKDAARAGGDYFDPDSEILAESRSAIAQVFRATTATRRLLVSAEESLDVNGRQLAFHWVVLRGDPAKVRITPLNDAKSRAEIVFTYQPRRPVAPGDALATSRVDVGVFAHNGAYYSPPAFVTSFALPCEGRTYAADGSLLEVGYGMGASRFKVKDWLAFFGALSAVPPSSAVALFFTSTPPEQLAAIHTLDKEYRTAVASAAEAQQKSKEAEAAAKEAPAESKLELEAALKKVRDIAHDAAKKRDELLTKKQPGFAEPWRDFVSHRLDTLAQDVDLFTEHHAMFTPLAATAEVQRKRLIALGIVRETNAPLYTLLPLLEGTAPPAERLSAWQHAQLTRFHGEVLAAALPGIAHEYRMYLTDYQLTRPKVWRDVYHYRYIPGGVRTGWTRYDESGRYDFNADGLVVSTRDSLGRPATATPVQYQLTTPGTKLQPWEWPPMRFTLLFKAIPYEYDSNSDHVGHPVQDPRGLLDSTQPSTSGKRPVSDRPWIR